MNIKKTIKKLLLLVIVVVLCSGCYRISYKLNSARGQTSRHEYWNNYFVFGLIPHKDRYDLSNLCPASQMVEANSHQTPANVIATLLGALTAASTLEVVCLQNGEDAGWVK